MSLYIFRVPICRLSVIRTAQKCWIDLCENRFFLRKAVDLFGGKKTVPVLYIIIPRCRRRGTPVLRATTRSPHYKWFKFTFQKIRQLSDERFNNNMYSDGVIITKYY